MEDCYPLYHDVEFSEPQLEAMDLAYIKCGDEWLTAVFKHGNSYIGAPKCRS